MRVFGESSRLVLTLALSLAVAACQQPATNTSNASVTTNTGNINATTNANTTTMTTSSGATVNTREPERYSAQLVMTAQTEGGERAAVIPSLMAQVARDGVNRRVSFRLPPNNEEVVYLNRGDQRFVILPGRRQYAELTREATGFDIPPMMTPGQLVTYVQNQRGYERVGEEMLNGRRVTKYRYAGTSNTNTQAGTVAAESFVYVDEETGLPLRADLTSTASGNVEGVRGLRVQAEMRDVNTNVDAATMEVPREGYTQISPDQIRQQVNAVTSAAAAILGQIIRQASQPTASPAAGGASSQVTGSPSPSATTTGSPR